MEGLKDAIEDLKLILEERESGYKLADFTLDTTGRSEAESLIELKRVAGAFLQ
jgi:hypothetical protein